MSDEKFEWDATESAPKKYPMEIIRGTFIYKGEKERGLYIPSGGTLTGGWGKGISSHVVGEKYKPLPDRLSITFFSYAEKQFYQGEFLLPYDKILSLFQKGKADNPEYPTYSAIMAGIAPGGVVSVWVIGSGDYTEVFFGKARKVELNPSAAFNLPFENKQDAENYMDEGLEDELSPEEIAAIRKNGIPFDLWDRYRNRYHWIPIIKGGYSREHVNVNFMNGERERRWKKFDDINLASDRPVPKILSFESVMNGVETIFRVNFDEIETMDAFEKLGANGQKIYLEFEPKIPRTQTKVRLYNDKESIELKKIMSEDW